MTDKLPTSAACERNKAVIFEALKPWLQQCAKVLEIGSGTGQHGEYFAQQLSALQWQMTDQPEYLAGLAMRHSKASLKNLSPPYALDVNEQDWPASTKKYDAIFSANTLHIMDHKTADNFLSNTSTALRAQGLLFLYGPFKYKGNFTSASNAAFDESLRARQFGDGIKDFEWVEGILAKQNFKLVKDIDMSANNQLLIWREQTQLAD